MSSMCDNMTGPWACTAPKGCLFNDGANMQHILIAKEDLNDAIKVICSNESCPESPYMHSACFESFEDMVLQCLKTCSKAKTWTEKQKVQNLWTKRGYDLVYKACECNCGQGHIRKDLEWAPVNEEDKNGQDGLCGSGKRKRKKSRSQNVGKQTITIGLPMFGSNSTIPSSQTPPTSSSLGSSTIRRSDAQNVPCSSSSSACSNRARTHSVSSSSAGSPLSSSNSSSGSQGQVGAGAGAVGESAGSFHLSSSPLAGEGLLSNMARRNIIDRSRHDSGGSIFQRRMDYSSFNALPKHKINSYHIKMEDECSIGNDETRIFILSSYASNKMNRVPCVVCSQHLTIFDRYPLIDGTFFLSPRQHNKSCIQVKVEGKTVFLTAVCMGCLEGWSTAVACRFCLKPWNGSHLILGTMYSYDIFAASPCCAERLKCNNCNQMVIHPDQRFSFFSDYSQMVSCPSCGVQDFHFCKILNAVYVRGGPDAQKMSQEQQMAAMAGLRVHRVNSA